MVSSKTTSNVRKSLSGDVFFLSTLAGVQLTTVDSNLWQKMTFVLVD